MELIKRLTYFTVDRVVFGSHPLVNFLQVGIQHLIGGPRPTLIKFSEGPAKALSFHCLTSEKYFFERSLFEYPLRALLEQTVRPGWVTLEIGAHIGYWALVLSKLCGPRGRVIALEPSKTNFQRLVMNIDSNAITNVEAANLAAMDLNGPIPFSDSGSMSRLGGSATVQAIRLDDYLNPSLNPELMILDVEGQAGAVLRGARNVLRRAKPVLIYELHDEHEEEQVRTLLSDIQYFAKDLERPRGYPRRLLARSKGSLL